MYTLGETRRDKMCEGGADKIHVAIITSPCLSPDGNCDQLSFSYGYLEVICA